jgi:hypothetical protein
MWLGPYAGTTVPVGDLGKAMGPGFVGGLTGTYALSRRDEVGLDLVYHDWGARDFENSLLTWASGSGWYIDGSALQANVRATRYTPSLSRTSLYGTLGSGASWMTGSLKSYSGAYDFSGSELGFNFLAGAGVNLDLNPAQRVSVGVLFQRVIVGTDPTDFVAVGMNVMWRARSR